MKVNELQLQAWDGKHLRSVESIDFDTLEVWFNDTGKYPGEPQQMTDPELRRHTGLKDKNKIDVYEGDILKKANGMKYKIKWTDNPYRSGWNISAAHKGEVIGNIYEGEKS